MEVSIWWAIGACFAGVSIGFALCAALVMAREEDSHDLRLSVGPDVQTYL
jgi:hypothetical protein